MDRSHNQAFVVFHGRFPSEKAAGLFAAENAKSLAPHMPVTIVVPRRNHVHVEDAYRVYGLPAQVQIKSVFTIDFFSIPHLGPVPFIVSSFVFACAAYVYLRTRVYAKDVIFTNDLLIACMAILLRGKVIYEVHDYPEHWKWGYRFLFQHIALVLATNEWKANALRSEFNLSQEKLLMERNGVDVESFTRQSREIARKELRISTAQTVVVYTGHLYTWKGVDVLLQAATELPECEFYCVGGTPEDVRTYRTRYQSQNHIHFIGHVAHEQIPLWQSAADLLVLPNTGTEEISTHYTSPMKLFEYMASERPIVATRLPSVLEIVDESRAFLCEPDNPKDLSRAICAVCKDPENAAVRARAARAWVLEHSWGKRAVRILNKVSSI